MYQCRERGERRENSRRDKAVRKNEQSDIEALRNDRMLFSSLLQHIVQTPSNEDPTDFVLASIGRNVGADRCYVYRF